MKLKSLFLCMLGAAVLVGCNNEIDGGDYPLDEFGKPIIEGESTSMSLSLKLAKPNTYAGGSSVAGSGNENTINNAALFIYKLDGTPEAMAFLASIHATDDINSITSTPYITVQCKSGQKLVYLAVNIGTGTGAGTLINAGVSATNTNAGNLFVGLNWNNTDASGFYGPRFFNAYTDAASPAVAHEPLNAAIWATTSSYELETSLTTYTPTGISANPLIQALSGGGVVANGALTGIGSLYLMSNWGDASTQPSDTLIGTGTNYVSTCLFTLAPGISADDSRAATADVTNANGENALLINIQRAVAKVSVSGLTGGTSENAGSGSNAGTFVPGANWALGNINRSEYPFQMWSGKIVRSTRYGENVAILPKASNANWSNKMDNSRWVAAAESYEDQNLTTPATVATINSAANQAFGTSNLVLSTENNNGQTYNQYSTFIVFSGLYTPASYITGVSNVGVVSTATTAPSYAVPNTSMFYVSSYGSDGLFFHGEAALRQYICFTVLGKPSSTNPLTDTDVLDAQAVLMETSGMQQAKLQEYVGGICFYRVWVRDPGASEAANKILVRRNHIYEIAISSINGPGIGNPNDIIDPHPEEPDEIEEADTYVTATVNIMQWHVVSHSTGVILD